METVEITAPEGYKFKEVNEGGAIIFERVGGGRWKPKIGDSYWTPIIIHTGITPQEYIWQEDYFDNSCYLDRKVFKTKEECEVECKRGDALTRVLQYIEDSFEPFEPNWQNNNQRKHSLSYDSSTWKFDLKNATVTKRAMLLPYLSSREEVQQLIENCEADLKLIFKAK